MNRFFINDLIYKFTILKHPVAYCTVITCNLLGLLEGRLVYYETILTVAKHLFRIIISTSPRRIFFNLTHATPISEHMGGRGGY